jgi:hypothetical protein
MRSRRQFGKFNGEHFEKEKVKWFKGIRINHPIEKHVRKVQMENS